MHTIFRKAAALAGLLFLFSGGYAQHAAGDSSTFYNEVHTYVNPVLPGDHPDPTLIRVGKDFYHCGSSFHFNPYLPIYHSTDLVHWEVISRVLPPSRASFVVDRPSAGIWQGAITHFYGSYWIYFSSNGQWVSKASSPYGPWSEPVSVKTDSATGWLGYDNSIFIDDDGKPYMVIKNGQKINRLRAVGHDGQLTDTVINLDWINANLQYSWAEGPVMCKRNGYYFYFPAGDVSGGQYVLRSRKLTADSTQWERLGDFFKPVTDPHAGFRRPNHIAAPLQLEDGSWWTIGQSYEKYDKAAGAEETIDGGDWSGMGRQTSLFPVTWENDRPWGMAPVSTPILAPQLKNSGIPWRSMHSDDFTGDSLALYWHFLDRTAAQSYSLAAKKGWIRLAPQGKQAHLVQKETDHYYTALTRVDFDATDTADKAGILLTNGNQHVTVRLYTGYENGKKIMLRSGSQVRSIPNNMGNTVWLKITRKGHTLSGYCSADREHWVSLGSPVNVVDLDKVQPNFNSWVGTSVGLFAAGHPADFDAFVCKDGFSPLEAIGYKNYFGVEKTVGDEAITNSSDNGGWFMLSGVDLGQGAGRVSVTANVTHDGTLEIWADDLGKGIKIANLPVKASNGQDRTFKANLLKKIIGNHDIFVKFPSGTKEQISIKQVLFSKK